MNSTRLVQFVLRSPLVWGALVTVAFYSLLDSGQIGSLPGGETLESCFRRYFAGHWIEYVEGTMFFFGLAALALKLLDLAGQSGVARERLLAPAPAGGQTAADAASLLGDLQRLPARLQESYLVRRLREAIEHIERQGSADGLEAELKYLADQDTARAHASYALVRIIIWAIPILGFLGTVTGITLAIANLAPQALEESLLEVTSGLGVAFDTTAVALAQSIVLMFGQFLCDRVEGRLLARVDDQARRELAGRFQQATTGGDPQVAAMRRMAEAMIEATEEIVRRQVEIWQASISAAHEQWTKTATATERQLEKSLSLALDRSLQTHAQQLAAAARQSAEQNQRHWAGVGQALVQATEAVTAQQRELVRQGEVLRQVVDSTAQLTRLEEALNRNLSALAGAQNFEETVQSLAAVIHLLNARLGQAPAHHPGVARPSRPAGQAA